MTHVYAINTAYGASGSVNPTHADESQHTGNTSGASVPRYGVFDNGMDASGAYGRRPWFLELGVAGWTASTWLPTKSAAGLFTSKLAYILLSMGWVGFTAEVTEAGATTTGNGAAHLPGQTKHADKTRNAHNKDVLAIIQDIKSKAATYGIDPDLNLAIASSSGGQIIGQVALQHLDLTQWGDAVAASDDRYLIDPGFKALVVPNIPWTHRIWGGSQTIVGNVCAVSPTSDTKGSTKASVDWSMLREFNPYEWFNERGRGRPIPMYLAYTDPSAAGAVFEKPGIGSVYDTTVHPITQGEIAKRQLRGIDNRTGLPWVSLRAWGIDEDPTFGSELAVPIRDNTSVLDCSAVRDVLAWVQQAFAPYFPDDYWAARTRAINTNAATTGPAESEWRVAAWPTPQEREVTIQATGSSGTDPRYIEVLAQPELFPEPDNGQFGQYVRVLVADGTPNDPEIWRQRTKGAVFVRNALGVASNAELVHVTS